MAPTPVPWGKVLACAGVQFVNSYCIFVTTPFVPFLVHDFFPDYSPSEIGYASGWLEASYQVGSFGGALLWGRFGDIYGRRPALILGLVGTLICPLFFGFARQYYVAMFARFLWGLLSGNVGVAKTFLAEVLDETNQARGFSAIGIANGFGRLFGPSVGGLLARPALQYTWFQENGAEFWRTYPYILPCLVSAFVTAVALVVALFTLNETLANPEPLSSCPNHVLPGCLARRCCSRGESGAEGGSAAVAYAKVAGDDQADQDSEEESGGEEGVVDGVSAEVVAIVTEAATAHAHAHASPRVSSSRPAASPADEKNWDSDDEGDNDGDDGDDDGDDEGNVDGSHRGRNHGANADAAVSVGRHVHRAILPARVQAHASLVDSDDDSPGADVAVALTPRANDSDQTPLRPSVAIELPNRHSSSSSSSSSPSSSSASSSSSSSFAVSPSPSSSSTRDVPGASSVTRPSGSGGTPSQPTPTLEPPPEGMFALWAYLLRDRRIAVPVAVYGSVSFISMAGSEVLPLSLLNDAEHGGFGFGTGDIGLLSTLGAPFLLTFQAFISYRVVERFKMLRATELFLFLHAGSLVLQAWTSVAAGAPKWAQWSLLTVSSALIITTRIGALTNIFILISNAAIPQFRGTVNGLGQCASAFARVFAPPIATSIFAWSATNPILWPILDYHLVWYLLALVSIAVAVFIVRRLPKDLEKKRETVLAELGQPTGGASGRPSA